MKNISHFFSAMIIDYRDCCLKEPSFGCQWIMWYGDYQVSEVTSFDINFQKMKTFAQQMFRFLFLYNKYKFI